MFASSGAAGRTRETARGATSPAVVTPLRAVCVAGVARASSSRVCVASNAARAATTTAAAEGRDGRRRGLAQSRRRAVGGAVGATDAGMDTTAEARQTLPSSFRERECPRENLCSSEPISPGSLSGVELDATRSDWTPRDPCLHLPSVRPLEIAWLPPRLRRALERISVPPTHSIDRLPWYPPSRLRPSLRLRLSAHLGTSRLVAPTSARHCPAAHLCASPLSATCKSPASAPTTAARRLCPPPPNPPPLRPPPRRTSSRRAARSRPSAPPACGLRGRRWHIFSPAAHCEHGVTQWAGI